MNKTVLIILIFAGVYTYGAEGDIESLYNAKLFNTQNFYVFKSALDPDSILPVSDGYSGMMKYYLDSQIKVKDLSFYAADYGFFQLMKSAVLTNKIVELFLSYKMGICFIDAGKKKITQSASFLKSPIDFVLNSTKDISKDRDYNLEFAEGKFMANLDLFSDFGVFGICCIPEMDFTNDGITYFSSPQAEQEEFRYSVNLSGVDAGLAVSHDKSWQAGANLSFTFLEFFEFHAEGAYLQNKDVLRIRTNRIIIGYNPVLMENITADLLTNVVQTVNDATEFIIGGSYNNEYINLMIEYYFNPSGYNYDEWKDILKTARDQRKKYDGDKSDIFNQINLGTLQNHIYSPGIAELCEHYLMIRITNPPSEKSGLSAVALFNLQDLSGIFIPGVCYTGWDHLSLSVNASFSFGDDYSEFKLLGQDWAVSLEVEIFL